MCSRGGGGDREVYPEPCVAGGRAQSGGNLEPGSQDLSDSTLVDPRAGGFACSMQVGDGVDPQLFGAPSISGGSGSTLFPGHRGGQAAAGVSEEDEKRPPHPSATGRSAVRA